MFTRSSKLMLAGVLVLFGGAALAAAPDTAASTASNAQTMGEAQTGVWTPKETKFVYQGFTTKYSCDSLSDVVEGVLRQLGARRSDLKVRRTGCTESLGKPSPFPGTDIKMSVLQPAPAGAPASDGVPAHWKLVNVRLNNEISNESGQCELIEQLRQTILPLFTTRKVDSQTDCIPHQLSVGRPTLKVEVLMPDAQPPKKS